MQRGRADNRRSGGSIPSCGWALDDFGKFFRERAKGLVADSRLRAQVRASRAYLAGFGTTGSLLAGAALLFLLASAIVSFKGWPQVGAPSSPIAVAVSAP